MAQNKLIGLVLIVLGAIALYFGFNATNSPTEEVSEALTGRYSDETMMYLAAGAVAVIAGAVLAFRK